MDARSLIRSVIVALVSIGMVVLVIVLLVKGFSGKPSSPSSRINVGNYAYSSAIATLLIDGPTSLDQTHYQMRISVSNSQNEIDVIQGYQGNVVKRQVYTNNSAGFGTFLQALQLQNFSRGTKSPSDYRGYCPFGDRYVYSFTNDQDELFTYWSTSCGGQGTFQGSAQNVRRLFEQQVPQKDLNTLIGGTGLSL